MGGAWNQKKRRKRETQDVSFMGHVSQGRKAPEWAFQLQLPIKTRPPLFKGNSALPRAKSLVLVTLQVEGKTFSSSVFSNSCHRLVVHVSDTLLTGSLCGALEGVRPWTAGLPTSSKSNVLILLSLDVPPKNLPGGPKSGMGIVPTGVDHFLYPQAHVSVPAPSALHPTGGAP